MISSHWWLCNIPRDVSVCTASLNFRSRLGPRTLPVCLHLNSSGPTTVLVCTATSSDGVSGRTGCVVLPMLDVSSRLGFLPSGIRIHGVSSGRPHRRLTRMVMKMIPNFGRNNMSVIDCMVSEDNCDGDDDDVDVVEMPSPSLGEQQQQQV